MITQKSDMKSCTKCGKDSLPTTEYFYQHKGQKSGLRPDCKRCTDLQKEQYRQTPKGKEAFRKASKKQTQKSYGISPEDYNKIFDNQGGCCAICGEHQSTLNRDLDLDHNHGTGKIRGFLCNKHNKALGLLDVDKLGIELLLSAISYLKNNDESI